MYWAISVAVLSLISRGRDSSPSNEDSLMVSSFLIEPSLKYSCSSILFYYFVIIITLMKKEKIKLLYFFQRSGYVVLFNGPQSLKNDFGRVHLAM